MTGRDRTLTLALTLSALTAGAAVHAQTVAQQTAQTVTQPAAPAGESVRPRLTAPGSTDRPKTAERSATPVPSPDASGTASTVKPPVPGKARAVTTTGSLGAGTLSAVFGKVRSASLRLEDCPPKDSACAQPNGVGSGVVISPDGLVLTAYHVLKDSPNLTAVTLGKARYTLRAVGFDERHDLALLRLNLPGGTTLPAVSLASLPPRVGESALAIGNSGEGPTSFLAAKNGTLLALDAAAGRATFPPGTLEMDAPLAPGDSGGPILNANGQLIGITSYIRIIGGSRARPVVKSYAVPVSTNNLLLAELRAGVKREAPVIGIRFSQVVLPPEAFAQLGLGKVPGFLFDSVTPGGPAARAGLRPVDIAERDKDGRPTRLKGDVIAAVDGRPVTTFDEFQAAVRNRDPGDRVTLTIYRDGSNTPLTISLTLVPYSSLN